MNTISKNIGIMLMVCFVANFAAVGSAFAHDIEDHAITAPALVDPVKPVWESWDLKTVGLQLTSIPLALGVGASNLYFSVVVADSYFERADPGYEGFDHLDERLGFWAGSAAFGYSLSQGLLIGAIGDSMGGDGGLVAPAAAGLLNMAVWSGVLYLVDYDPDYYNQIIAGFLTTTLLSQLAAYHLTASFREGDSVASPSALSNFSFGVAPTDGGASIGLGFFF